MFGGASMCGMRGTLGSSPRILSFAFWNSTWLSSPARCHSMSCCELLLFPSLPSTAVSTTLTTGHHRATPPHTLGGWRGGAGWVGCRPPSVLVCLVPGRGESARLFVTGPILEPLLVVPFCLFLQQALSKRAKQGCQKVANRAGVGGVGGVGGF